MNATRTLIIAGAGIAGLTAALTLSRAGFRILVLEQAPGPPSEGAGIQLSPNATNILSELGLLPELLSCSCQPDDVRLFSSSSGKQIARIPLGKTASERYSAPYLVLRRQDLQEALLKAAHKDADIEILYGQKVIDAAAHSRGLSVSALHDKRHHDHVGLALIGADGVWSSVRTKLLNLKPAQYSGHTAWRATLPIDEAEDIVGNWVSAWMGPDAHLVAYPIRNGHEINIVAIIKQQWKAETWSENGDVDELLEKLANWHIRPRELVTRAKSWHKWAVCQTPATSGWSNRLACLIGDAAHAMVPFFAQGGAMAIEDAAILAQCLTHDVDTLEEGFKIFEKIRTKRVADVLGTARKNGRIFEAGWPISFARNMVLKSRSPQSLLTRQDWVYGWQAGNLTYFTPLPSPLDRLDTSPSSKKQNQEDHLNAGN